MTNILISAIKTADISPIAAIKTASIEAVYYIQPSAAPTEAAKASSAVCL